MKIATRQPNDNYVIDEGLFHFNFVFATSCVDCPGAVFDYTAYGIPEIVIVVASENNIVERLSNRGHNYIEDPSDESSIREFVALNEKVLVALQRYLKEHGISSRIIEIEKRLQIEAHLEYEAIFVKVRRRRSKFLCLEKLTPRN